MGEPIEGAREAMSQLDREGHRLIIHTVRGDKPEHVIDWLHFFQIPFDEVTRVKPAADLYLDDRAVRFETWEKFMQDLKGS